MNRTRIRIKWRRPAFALVATLLLCSIADYWLFPLARPGGRVENDGRNGLWLHYSWYFGRHSPTECDVLAERLTKEGIQDAFFHVRGVESSGKLKYRLQAPAQNLNLMLRQRVPLVRRLAWVYVDQATVDVSNPAVRSQLAAEASWLVRVCGFDGIQWDYEICPDRDPSFLRLLQETRTALPKGAFLSAAVPTWYPFPFSRVGWSEAYYKDVAERCDQMAVMAYDTAAYSPRAYCWFVSEQVSKITRATAGTGCKVLIGIPTYKDGTPSHNPRAENLRMALLGVRQALDGPANLRTWQGVSVFADYTTSPREWREYEELWPQRRSKP